MDCPDDIETFAYLDLFLPLGTPDADAQEVAFYGVRLWLSRGLMQKYYGYGETLLN